MMLDGLISNRIHVIVSMATARRGLKSRDGTQTRMCPPWKDVCIDGRNFFKKDIISESGDGIMFFQLYWCQRRVK